MSLEDRHAAAVFDPGSGTVPPELEPVVAGSDAPVLLLVSSDAEEAAPELAVGIAEARSERGLDTILADADLDAPRLHTLLGAENLEGVVDLFLFGASLARVAQRAGDRAFRFIPAGGYAPDPGEILSSARWARITEELAGSGTLLLVFVPAGAPGLGELSGRIGLAVLLADEASAQRISERLDPTCRVLATVRSGRPGETQADHTDAIASAAAGAGAGGLALDAPEDRSSLAQPDDQAGEAGHGGGTAPAVPAGELPPEAPPSGTGDDGVEPGELPGDGTSPDPEGGATDLTEPVVIRDEPDERRHFPLLLILLVVALVAGWFGYQHFFAGAPAEPAEAAESMTAPAPRERGEPIETPLPFSVAVEAHQDLGSAQARAARLSEAEPEVTFYLAPVSVNGDLFYRLMAGPATDQESATALMQRLVDAGHKTAMDAWAIRPTTYAFLMGEFEEADEAAARVDTLADAGVPAYTIPVRFEGGQQSYRVYGGAYENQAEAQVMGELLENAGVEARLVTRTGEAAS